MLATNFPFDSTQMPLNPFDSQFHSFEREVLPELNRRGIAPLGMKPMQGHGESITKGALSPEDALRYAMSLPVATTITGMEKPEILQQNLKIAQNFKPMDAAEMQRVRDSVRQYAADGRFELYKLSLKFDNPEARLAHEFPLDMQSVEVKEMLQSTDNSGNPYPKVSK
jgi:predicted aldo/keto reductase-like oxidoreductase